jgi:hypothetical protein
MHTLSFQYCGASQREAEYIVILKGLPSFQRARDRCINPPFGDCFASDWDLSAKSKKALVVERVISSHSNAMPKRPIPVLRML